MLHPDDLPPGLVARANIDVQALLDAHTRTGGLVGQQTRRATGSLTALGYPTGWQTRMMRVPDTDAAAFTRTCYGPALDAAWTPVPRAWFAAVLAAAVVVGDQWAHDAAVPARDARAAQQAAARDGHAVPAWLDDMLRDERTCHWSGTRIAVLAALLVDGRDRAYVRAATGVGDESIRKWLRAARRCPQTTRAALEAWQAGAMTPEDTWAVITDRKATQPALAVAA